MTRPDRASNHDSYMVPSLERGLRLLSVLASARTELSLSELAERLELSRSSVFRLCYTLDQLGFVRRTRLGYEMGPRVLTIVFPGSGASAHRSRQAKLLTSIEQTAKPIFKNLGGNTA